MKRREWLSDINEGNMNFYTNFGMCVVCVMLFVTRNTASKQQNGPNNKSQRAKEALHLLTQYDERTVGKSKYVSTNFGNQTDKLLEVTKRNLILSFGLRKNMVLYNNYVRRREPHKYMLYITELYKNLTENGLSSMSEATEGCGRLGLPLPTLVNTVRGCTDIGDTDGKLADFPHIPFKFDISEIPSSETLIESKLKIMMQSPAFNGKNGAQGAPQVGLTRLKFKITLYIVLPKDKSSSHSAFPRLFKVKSKRIHVVEGQQSRWICFDTSNFVYGIGKHYINFVLRVQPLYGGNALDPKTLGFFKHDGEDTKKALLVLFTGDQNENPQSLRKKRGVSVSPDTKRGSRKNREKRKKSKRRKKRKDDKRKRRQGNRKRRRNKKCRRKDMIVDFHRFQWTNWVVSPIKYNAYHCHGVCKFPIPGHLKASNHAIIQSLVHSRDKSFVQPPCCVPHEFQHLMILALDGPDRVVLKRKEGLIAKNCACK